MSIVLNKLCKSCFKGHTKYPLLINIIRNKSTDSDEIPILINDIKSKYETLMLEMDKSSNTKLILWKGLKQLYCIKKLQSIEHFPSDLLWCHKTKNLYLLEIDRAIKQEKWREWLNICYGCITPINNNDNNTQINNNNNNNNNNNTPPNPDFIIDSNSLKTLIPFLIQQTLNDNHNDNDLKNNILQKLTPFHSQQILKQFRDRIERSDIKYISFKRNKFIQQYGNNPLKKFICYDHQFTTTINDKLNQLSEIDKNLTQKFIQCWNENDNVFKQFTNPDPSKLNAKNIMKEEEEEEEEEIDDLLLYWYDEKEKEKEKERYFLSNYNDINIPSSYISHYDLLRHTIDDCSKLSMLNKDLLSEGYSGDNGHNKWGLWRANNLPIILLRPHLLRLRDILCNDNMMGSYIEVGGKYGSGKSVALMYAVNIVRESKNNDWLCIYCPNTHEWIQDIKLTIPANDRNSIFYQHDYARQFFNRLKIAESECEKLKNIPFAIVTNNNNNDNNNDNDNDTTSKGNNIDLEMIYEMLQDPIDIKKYETKILNEWMRYGDGDGDGGVGIDKKYNNLYDMCVYGASMECKSPASLMYLFMDCIRKQNIYKVLIACDNINWWNNIIYGLSTPRNPKVFAWQLSMIDIFSQFQQINSLKNGIVIMSKTTMGRNRKPQFKTYPSHTIHCPDIFTNDEFDSIMWNYKGIKLCSNNIAPDDYKKIYAASAKRPIYTQRIAALY